MDVLFHQTRQWVDEHLLRTLKKFSWPEDLEFLCQHVLLGAGKALRPSLLIWCYQHTSGNKGKPENFVMDWALALEMVHTYSLVHDDLPAMDDDAFRRGRPTVHTLRDSATAILLGDALLTGAFELMSCSSGEASKNILALQKLAHSAGGAGMISGQLRDMSKDVPHSPLEFILKKHEEKTGALFSASMYLGVLAGGGKAESLKTASDLGINLGLYFQMIDDILDATASSKDLGKTACKDAHTTKLTFVGIEGLTAAQMRAEQLKDKLKVNFTQLNFVMNPNELSWNDILDYISYEKKTGR